MLSKRERLEKTIVGEAVDRVPIAFWRHWPGDDQRAADLARSTVEFQQRYDFDFVKISPASSFCITDYGVQDRWVGSLEGTREYTKRAIQRSLDWTELRSLDPARGALGRQVECVQLVAEGLKNEVPIIQTIFSPLAQAKNLAGQEQLITHLRKRPDRVHTGLNIITENTLRFIDELQHKTNIDGIFYAVQHARYNLLSEEEYATFGRPYDLRILEALTSKWWFNMLHLHGNEPMFEQFVDYPVQAVNWHDRETEPDLATGKGKFSGAVCGGLSRMDPMHNGTPAAVRDQARDAIEQTNGRRFILSTGCVTMITSPLSNIRAARTVVDEVV